MKVLSICGSPRRGNSEAILNKLKEFLEEKGVENKIILLRTKNIHRCDGCVEYCNKHLKCRYRDDMDEILEEILQADGLVFAMPNYFAMPPGIFKDFIDRCSVLYTSYEFTKKPDLSNKKAVVITVGTDKEFVTACKNYIAKWFCETLRLKVVAKEGFLSRSELKGNYNDIFENSLNPDILERLRAIAEALASP